VLAQAPLPPGTDLHLLGHTIGDELYKQQGIDGIKACTNDFRNACSHTIVIGAYSEFGEDALPKIQDACRQAPGGSGAYTMCFHGLGHGVFAYYGYAIPETVAACKKTGTEAYHNEEYGQCVGGMIMELVGGGGHDPERWQEMRAKYLSAARPLSPCDTSLIPEEVKTFCYQYITPNLFTAAGADLARPQPAHFRKAFELCDVIPKDNVRDRTACFTGVGKEFPTLAVGQDIRLLASPPERALMTMRDWCALAPHEEAHDHCIRSIVSSLYWGGERGTAPAQSFCSLMTDARLGGICADALIGQALIYKKEDVAGLCAGTPRPQCETL
jgi:hypothetical protein